MVDDTPPVAKYCPKTVIKYTQLNQRFRFDPRFQDNTGIARLDIDGLPGKRNAQFTITITDSDTPINPGEYLVTYRAIDKFGNTGLCQVQLLAERSRQLTRQINQTSTQKFDVCDDLEAPSNGHFGFALF